MCDVGAPGPDSSGDELFRCGGSASVNTVGMKELQVEGLEMTEGKKRKAAHGVNGRKVYNCGMYLGQKHLVE